ncbi:MAG: anhydro-N-acetylmuramic acid kinase [bacterium]
MRETGERMLAGCMSGTSADGADVVLVRFEGIPLDPRWELLVHLNIPYPDDLRTRVLAAASGEEVPLHTAARLGVALGRFYTGALERAMERAGIPSTGVDAAGLHGQTLFHDPSGTEPVSIQEGSAAVTAEHTGLAIVHDFRSRDIAAGGQGAPLVPFADCALLRRSDRPRAALNLGGIANITWLPAGEGTSGVRAFDVGPGNMLLDGIARRASGGELVMDTDGRMASAGEVIDELLEEWLDHPFFARTPPRSTGRETFGDPFLDPAWERYGDAPADLAATAAALTAEATARAVEEHLPAEDPSALEVVCSGGGVYHPVMMEELTERLAPARLVPSDREGIPPLAKEAMAFALLAWAHLEGVPAGMPAVTGARRAVLLGSLTPGSGDAGRRDGVR